MRIGAHISTAGGAFNAFPRAAEIGCESMLVFTKSNRQWRAKPLSQDDIDQYKAAAAAHADIRPVSVHASYLINVASPKPDLWEKSYQALLDEVSRAERLGISLLTFHPGSHMESTVDEGLAKIGRALRRLNTDTDGFQVTVCLETMAGQGTNLGNRFEHLAALLDEAERSQRFGVCFDTCHVFAAGYDIRTPAAYAKTMAEFDQVVGLDWIKGFHFNDSKHELGSNRDRHQHIGDGFIGREGFANFLNDPRWADHPAHLETPKIEKDEAGAKTEMDPINMATLRSLRQE